jgi:hypothetical protein
VAPDPGAFTRRHSTSGTSAFTLSSSGKLSMQKSGCTVLCSLSNSASVVTPDSTSAVVRPPFCPNMMSVSSRSPTMQIWSGCRLKRPAMLRSMKPSGLPTTVGSRLVLPLIAPTCTTGKKWEQSWPPRKQQTDQ